MLIPHWIICQHITPILCHLVIKYKRRPYQLHVTSTSIPQNICYHLSPIINLQSFFLRQHGMYECLIICVFEWDNEVHAYMCRMSTIICLLLIDLICRISFNSCNQFLLKQPIQVIGKNKFMNESNNILTYHY